MNVLSTLNEILRDRRVTEVDVKPEANLLRDLAMDSLDVMDMIMEVEDRFDIMISQDELAKVSTLNDLAIVVRDKLAK